MAHAQLQDSIYAHSFIKTLSLAQISFKSHTPLLNGTLLLKPLNKKTLESILKVFLIPLYLKNMDSIKYALLSLLQVVKPQTVLVFTSHSEPKDLDLMKDDLNVLMWSTEHSTL